MTKEERKWNRALRRALRDRRDLAAADSACLLDIAGMNSHADQQTAKAAEEMAEQLPPTSELLERMRPA